MNFADDKAVDAQSAAESPQAPEDPRLTKAMEEFLAELEAGRNPSHEDFLARYPDIASDLAVCLEGIEFVHRIGPRIGQGASGPSAKSGPGLQPLAAGDPGPP